MDIALNFKSYNKGPLRGFFDLRYGGLTIKGCRLMEGNDGLWFAFPSQREEENGETRYRDFLYLTPPERAHLTRLVIAELESQGHIEGQRPRGGPSRNNSPARRWVSPEGEDLSEYYSQGAGDDVPF